jgi:hypothetical protein
VPCAPYSASTRSQWYRPKVLVEPIQRLADQAAEVVRHVPALQRDMLLVIRWRAQQFHEAKLRRHRGLEIVLPVNEQNGHLYTRREVCRLIS